MLQLSRQITGALIATIAAVLLTIGGAQAGDRALLEVIGYSPDGRYFAFEEYGIQDGSGFAYAHIFVVDVIEDRWVIGTPIDVQAENEETGLHAVRQQARAQAQPRLDSLEVYRPADVLAYIGSGAFDTEGLSLDFGMPDPFGFGQPDQRYVLVLDMFEAASAAPCKDWFDIIAKGFSLNLIIGDSDVDVHVDDVVPRSRGCPVQYKITGVYAPFEAADLTHAVALLSVYPRGFEGPDRRFIAVPLGAHLQ